MDENLDAAYQPYPTGTPPVLKRYRFVPPGFDPPYATVVVVPPDIFHDDMITDSGEPHENQASYDLNAAGFLVFQVETRLAPPGKLPFQLSADAGLAPEQTDDLKRQILAALADPLCNGDIYLVGGSAGGCLILWVALDPANTVSGWADARTHIKAVVSLSGPTNFCDWAADGNIPMRKLTDFENDLDEYVGLADGTDCDHDTAGLLKAASPYWLVMSGTPTSSPPAIILYTTTGDHVPDYQAQDMYTALSTHYGLTGHDFQWWEMNYTYGSGREHAFEYWHAINNATGSDDECVSEEVIDFLESY